MSSGAGLASADIWERMTILCGQAGDGGTQFGVWILIAVLMSLCICLAAALRRCHRLTQRVRLVMEQVNDVIEGLIHHKKLPKFSETEDTLLGKFQHGIFQLYGILSSYEERERRQKEELGSTISDLVHQMNTPIANIRLYSGFLEDTELSAGERQVFAKSIAWQAEKLVWLGESFGKLSRLETGIVKLQPVKQPVLPALLGAIDQITLKAKENGNDIRLSGNQKLTAVFDRKWTEEVFYNLLDNAVKYGNRDSAIATCLVEGEIYVRIDVVNEGPQIPEKEYPKIFQRFYRGEAAGQKAGVGLGLYLARELVREQGGYIKVTGRPDGRTMFSVYLPCCDGVSPERSPDKADEAQFVSIE